MKGKDLMFALIGLAVLVGAGGFVIFMLITAPQTGGVPAGYVGGTTPITGVPQGACVLSTQQTLGIASYDADQPGTSTPGATFVVYNNPTTGELNPGDDDTTPGETYTVYAEAANYFAALKPITTTCIAGPPVSLKQKAVDTAVVATVFNSDGVSPNTGGSQTVGVGGTAQVYVNMVQSANYLHLGGVDDRFVVYLSGDDITEWQPNQMSMIFDSKTCTPLAQSDVQKAQPTTLSGSYLIYAAVCSGDFAPQDGNIHKLAIRLQASPGGAPGTQTLDVDFGGVDYYPNSITGVIEKGAADDTGTEVQALQNVGIDVN